jgi:hypothetical protein
LRRANFIPYTPIEPVIVAGLATMTSPEKKKKKKKKKDKHNRIN